MKIPDHFGARHPIPAENVADEYDWLLEHPCACGGTGWKLLRQAAAWKDERTVIDELQVACIDCGGEERFWFRLGSRSP